MPKPRIRFAYAGIRVRDVERSLRFYRGLGFTVRRRGAMEHGGRWVQLDFPGTKMRLELNYYPRGNRFYERYRAGSELDHLGFAVDDVDEWVKKAKRLGGKLAADFRETSERLAYIRDPDGVWLEFFGATTPALPAD